MLAAGGTGGHLFPALALAQELNRRAIPVDLVTDMRGHHYGTSFPARAIYRIPSATFAGRAVLQAGRTAWMLARGIGASLKLLGRIRPGAVVGFGGYPSFPPLVAARLRNVPTALHEQNAVLGRANRALARHVTAVAASFENTKFLTGGARTRARVTGNPVRDEVIDRASQSYRPPDRGGPFSLLVFGGSQGARYFADTVPPAVALLPQEIKAGLSVVQQCREEDMERVEAAYAAASVRARLATFFDRLPDEMANAHLVIARSGASTVAELAVMGRPAILVPLPHAIDNDQLQNARRLADSGGAWCMEQKDLTPRSLGETIGRLLSSPETLAQAAAAAGAQGRPDAVERLADLVEELLGRRPRGAASRACAAHDQ
jgi:UDP-N-acetylglucosamine--N-acetylmuramyl-(pentapeptide) pyrophosphoryl-undecaprenol N-acetylglucosamine transferase